MYFQDLLRQALMAHLAAATGQAPLGNFNQPTEGEQQRQIESMAPYIGTFTPGMSQGLQRYIPGTRIPDLGVPAQDMRSYAPGRTGVLEGFTETPFNPATQRRAPMIPTRRGLRAPTGVMPPLDYPGY